jgi:hypothetical protein
MVIMGGYPAYGHKSEGDRNRLVTIPEYRGIMSNYSSSNFVLGMTFLPSIILDSGLAAIGKFALEGNMGDAAFNTGLVFGGTSVSAYLLGLGINFLVKSRNISDLEGRVANQVWDEVDVI